MSLVVLPSVTVGPSLLCRRALVSSGLGSYLKLAQKNLWLVWAVLSLESLIEHSDKRQLMEDEDGRGGTLKRQTRRSCPSECEKKKSLTEDRKWWGALQSVELLLQSPPEVDLLQENLLELLCKRRKTDAKRIVRNEYTVKTYPTFGGTGVRIVSVTQMNSLYLSPCSQHPSLAAQEKSHRGFDHLTTQRETGHI